MRSFIRDVHDGNNLGRDARLRRPARNGNGAGASGWPTGSRGDPGADTETDPGIQGEIQGDPG